MAPEDTLIMSDTLLSDKPVAQQMNIIVPLSFRVSIRLSVCLPDRWTQGQDAEVCVDPTECCEIIVSAGLALA